MAYIYCIINDINDKVYIGKTVYSIDHRFKEHIRDAYNHKCNSKLHRAILKYGKEHFQIKEIEECLDSNCGEREQYYIQLYDSVNNGYNISYGGEGESQVDLKQLKELHSQGYDFKQIAEMTGHTTKTVATRLKACGCESPHKNSSGYKGKGQPVEFNGLQFPNFTSLAQYLKENIDVFRDKEIITIVKGISKNSKKGTKYCGYDFHRL